MISNRKYRLVQWLKLLTVVFKLLKAALELLNLAFNYMCKDASPSDTPTLDFPIRAKEGLLGLYPRQRINKIWARTQRCTPAEMDSPSILLSPA